MNVVVHRVSPQQARYTPAGGREKCSFCRFYIAPKWCGHVTGPVSPMGWCKYFSQEMRQQFGGSTVTSGIPAGATLALDFMSAGNMPAGVTFTRASPATYTDAASGVIQTAAVNQPRWEARGLLIEEPRTNLWLQSADANNAAWNKTSSGGPVLPVTTANQTTAPDGTLTAASVVYPAVNVANSYCVLYQGLTTTANPHTLSVWLKGSVGGEQLYVGLLSGGGTRAVLTTQWQRFSYTLTTGAGTNYFIVGTDLRGAQSATPAQTVYAWGGQVEQGAFAPTSYIPTLAASVTRAQDACYISSIGSAPWFSAAQGTLSLEYDAANPGGIQGGFSDGSTANLIYFSQNGGANCFVASVSKSVVTTPVFAFPATNKIAASYQPNRFSAVINGGAVATDATIPAGPFLWTSRLTFGCSPWGLDTQIGGHMRRATFWPRALSDAEMQQVTT